MKSKACSLMTYRIRAVTLYVIFFLQISSVRGNEVLIAAEFQQRLRLRFDGLCNCTTGKGCVAVTARFSRQGM